jgi:hypothetical protein
MLVKTTQQESSYSVDTLIQTISEAGAQTSSLLSNYTIQLAPKTPPISCVAAEEQDAPSQMQKKEM